MAAQTAMELRLQWRNGENLLVTLGIPLGILLFFTVVDVLPRPRGQDAVEFLAPGVLALAIVSSAMVSLGIATAFERFYLVLKRLGATPLTRGELIVAKLLAVVATQLVQAVLVVGVAVALGWRPDLGRWWLVLPAVLLGTAAFAGLGLAMAGRLRAVAVLAVANALFIVLLLISGIVVPLDDLPTLLRGLARLLPAAPLVEWLRAALGGQPLPSWAWVVLPLWAVGTPLLAARTFRWD